MAKVERRTPGLSECPDLVVIFPARGGPFSARGRADQPAAPDALGPAVQEEELT